MNRDMKSIFKSWLHLAEETSSKLNLTNPIEKDSKWGREFSNTHKENFNLENNSNKKGKLQH